MARRRDAQLPPWDAGGNILLRLQPSRRTILLFCKSSPSSKTTTSQSSGSKFDDPAGVNYRSFSWMMFSPSDPDDWALLEEEVCFACNQLVIYTWLLYSYQFPATEPIDWSGGC